LTRIVLRKYMRMKHNFPTSLRFLKYILTRTHARTGTYAYMRRSLRRKRQIHIRKIKCYGK
jgi:hypothetical protein